MTASQLQNSGMLAREQLLYMFDRFSILTSQSEVKRRIRNAVNDKKEAVAVTTALQEEIFLQMGVDPSFGLACLGKVNVMFENDKDLIVRYCKFILIEEMACDEAELDPEDFADRLHSQQKLHEEQLEMLKYMRKFHLDDQSAILEKLHKHLEDAKFDSGASVVLSPEQIQEIVRRRVSPLFKPRELK